MRKPARPFPPNPVNGTLADAPELLTVNEAAAFLRITPAAARMAISRGQMPGVVRLGDRVRIRRDDLRKAVGLPPIRLPPVIRIEHVYRRDDASAPKRINDSNGELHASSVAAMHALERLYQTVDGGKRPGK